MFKILAPGARKRRVWSPATIAASLAVHGVLFYGAAKVSVAGPTGVTVQWDSIYPVPETPPPPVPATPPPPPLDEPRPADRPPPVVGKTVELVPPAKVPDEMPPPTKEPVTDPEHYRGQGKPGNTFGEPDSTDRRPPTRGGDGPPATGDGEVFAAEAVTDLPEVANRRELVRTLERTYPPMLRDAGLAGRVVVQLVVNTDGRVDPASIQVVSSTHPEFEAASRRAAERMRFRPAKVNGVPVRVMISLPIDWQVPN